MEIWNINKIYSLIFGIILLFSSVSWLFILLAPLSTIIFSCIVFIGKIITIVLSGICIFKYKNQIINNTASYILLAAGIISLIPFCSWVGGIICLVASGFYFAERNVY